MRKRITIIVAILLISAVCLGVFVACEAKEWGKFYSLQEAYDQGLLSVEDLKQIAEYKNNWKAEGRPKVEDLDKETANEIKETYVYQWKNEKNPIKEAKVSGVEIVLYLGTYNGCVITMISSAYHAHTTALRDVEIAGVMFHYGDGRSLEVYVKYK